MDPFTSEFLAGLAVEAIATVAGPVGRSFTKGKRHQAELLKNRIMVVNQDIVIQSLNRLEDLKLPPGEIDAIAAYLRSSEAAGTSRAILNAHLSGRYDQVNIDFEKQIQSCLVYLHSVSERNAVRVAPVLLSVMSRSIAAGIKLIATNNRADLENLKYIASFEVAAGALERLAARAQGYRRYSGEDLEELHEFVQKYLRLIYDRTGHIVTMNLEGGTRTALDDIYVQLTFRPLDRRTLRPQAASDGSIRTVSIDSVLKTMYRTVILGDPGGGKSTLAQALMHRFTEANGDILPDTWIPLMVTLREYDRDRQTSGRSICGFIAHWITREMGLAVSENLIELILITGRALVVLDGLDELTRDGLRHNMVQTIEAFGQLYPESALMVTSRRVGYDKFPLNREVFKPFELADFTPAMSDIYAAKWFGLIGRFSKSEQEEVSLAFREQSAEIEDLKRNPLMLSLLCSVFAKTRNIPQNRAELYEDCASLLFQRWDHTRGIVTHSTLRRDSRAALQAIAYWALTDPELESGIPEKSLLRKLTQYWRRRYESTEDARQEAQQLMSLWRGRAWILTDVGTDINDEAIYAFTHRTFMEYFAATHLSRQNPSPRKLWRKLIDRVSEGDWDIVAQLAIQSKDEANSRAVDKIYELIIADAESQSTTTLRQRTNILTFAARNFNSLLPSPKVTRHLVRACVDLALLGQPCWSEPPEDIAEFFMYVEVPRDQVAYMTLGPPKSEDAKTPMVVRKARTSGLLLFDLEELVASPEELLEPLQMLVNHTVSAHEPISDELIAYLRLLAGSQDVRSASKALSVLSNLDLLDAGDELVAVSINSRDDFIASHPYLPLATQNFALAVSLMESDVADCSKLVDVWGPYLLFEATRALLGVDYLCDFPVLGVSLAYRMVRGETEHDGEFDARDLGVLEALGGYLLSGGKEGCRVSLMEEVQYQNSFTDLAVCRVFADYRGISPKEPRSTPLLRSQELVVTKPLAILGGFIVLAVLAELDRDWPIYDESDEADLVKLEFGPLSILQTAFWSRRFLRSDVRLPLGAREKFDQDMKEHGVEMAGIEIIRLWTEGKFSFVL